MAAIYCTLLLTTEDTMGSTRKRGGAKTTLPPPSRPKRTPWQQARDEALRQKSYTKADVHRLVQNIYGMSAPSIAGVRAVLDGRYVDERVQQAFALLVAGPKLSQADMRKVIALYFPADEPSYRGPDTQTTRSA